MEINLGNIDNACRVILQPKDAINSHLLCLGASGCGKTVEAQRIMSDIVKQGGTVLAISIHSSLTKDQIYHRYVENFERYGKHVYANDGIPCEMFTKESYQDGTEETECDLICGVVDVICRTYKLGCDDRIMLTGAVENVVKNGLYQTNGFCAIGMQLQQCQERGARRLYERLKPMFVHNIFRSGTMIEQGKINIIHLDRLDLKTQQTAAELILAYIWRRANADAFKKHELWLFLDECQDYASGKQDALSLLISEGRKMGVNLILATQVMLGGRRNAVEERIMQCGTRLLFKPSGECLLQVAKLIDHSEYKKWIPVLLKLKSGEFIACGVKKVGSRSVDYPIKVSARDEPEHQ